MQRLQMGNSKYSDHEAIAAVIDIKTVSQDSHETKREFDGYTYSYSGGELDEKIVTSLTFM